MTISPGRVREPALITRLRATRLPPPVERRTLRKDAGATLRDVAEELRVSEASVSCWERGIYEPGPRHAGGYLRLLHGFAEFARKPETPASHENGIAGVEQS